MNTINHNLLPNIKKQKKDLIVEVELYKYTNELYMELENQNVIKRLKDVPQLGPIKVKQKFSKSRYDYIILQLYLHKIVKQNIQNELEITYNNQINLSDFMDKTISIDKKDRPFIGDILQMLTIIYNIGHFYNTFTSSRAIIIYANENEEFANKLINSSEDDRFKEAVKEYIADRNYHRLHLLNSLLVLEKCNQDLKSVKLAQEILYSYIDQNSLLKDNKMHYIFEIFKKVRDVSYMAYDLQISTTPLTIDLYDKDSLIFILRELLSFYNDQRPTEILFKSIGKLLDDTIYNEDSNAICYHQITKKMVKNLNSNYEINDYKNLWLNKNSILNKNYNKRRDYFEYPILKLTFDTNDKNIAQDLLMALEKTNHIRIGYYDRYSGEKTVLVSIKKNTQNKVRVAFRVLNKVISHLRSLKNIRASDPRFLLVTKFFLFYLFSENNITLKPTVDEEICVICARGKSNRINELEKILKKNIGTDDERHEVEFLIECLKKNNKNDTSIAVPSSILVLEKNRKLCEFDGMIIYPNRVSNQIVLMESKNRKTKPSLAKNCLIDKLRKLNIPYDEDQIKTENFDAMMELSV